METLRIDRKTVILVKPSQNNEAYRKKYIDWIKNGYGEGCKSKNGNGVKYKKIKYKDTRLTEIARRRGVTSKEYIEERRKYYRNDYRKRYGYHKIDKKVVPEENKLKNERKGMSDEELKDVKFIPMHQNRELSRKHNRDNYQEGEVVLVRRSSNQHNYWIAARFKEIKRIEKPGVKPYNAVITDEGEFRVALPYKYYSELLGTNLSLKQYIAL